MDYAPKVEFELEKVEPMTFEERMKGEKAMVGYPVSGHPLEGIEDFIKSKSKNLGAVEAWFEKMHNANNSDDENSENTNRTKQRRSSVLYRRFATFQPKRVGK